MPFTVRHALKHLARYNGVEGSCVDDPTNLERLNRVRELIYESPEDFVGTTEFVVIELGHCCHSFFLPEQLETARATARCNSPIPLLSKNYEFIDIGLARRCCYGHGHGNKRAPHFLHVNEARTRTPYFVDELPSGGRIQVTNDHKEDNGTELRFACRRNGRPLDFTLKLGGLSPVISKKGIDDILAVTKPLTKGNIMVWSVVGDSCPVLIAEYSGRNENPRFSKYSIHGGHHSFHNQDHRHQVVVYAKKKCFPYRPDDMDALVDIESLQGLIYGYQALNATEAEDDNTYVAKIKLMETMLERQDHNLEILEPMETCNVHYQTALDQHYWP